MRYFLIEIEDLAYRRMCVDYIGDDSLEKYKYMTHDEMHSSKDIEDFLRAIMIEAGTTLNSIDNRRVYATLIGDDYMLIWSIMLHKADDNDNEVIWKTWDWMKQDKLYYYKDKKPLDR